MLRCILVAVGLLSISLDSFGHATANVQITNRSPVELYRLIGNEIDLSVAPVSAPSPTGSAQHGSTYLLDAGLAVGFTFSYSMSVSDDGLPLPPDQPDYGPFWLPRGPILAFTPGPRATFVDLNGFEIGFTNIFTIDSCFPSCEPGIVSSPFWRLVTTTSDAVPEALSESGTGFAWIGVTSDAGRPLSVVLNDLEVDDVAFSAPVPEPDSYALMLGGLAFMAMLGPRRRSRPCVGASVND